jgi:hypothetical protein
MHPFSLTGSSSLIVSFRSDPSGALNFSGKAILHASGVDFSNGPSFAINMDQLQLGEELGNGAYGTVKRVLHKPTNVAMAMKVHFVSASMIIVMLTSYLYCRKFV